ncbi:hypothetical protein MLD38_024680 [Melastoma candidum]|uniref:Uncharacterized protein n=1 Tax=Melastoma candidum TaxID=119954 RepID=A0ACB9NWG7_9MYRT|nr:hypothetical protein MLD38_024680 [Melastoma candidum]
MGEEGGGDDGVVSRDAPQLATVLKEMKEGLDKVNARVRDLTSKVKASQFPTAEGISYLEAKHLLLLSYCQSLVYYLLRKARGLPIGGHPVVRSLVVIRLFLEKIRPIDKKLQYQIQKLTTAGTVSTDNAVLKEDAANASQKSEDLLKYRPNPDMLASKVDSGSDVDDVYKPPKFAPALMEEEKKSRQERNAWRKERQTLRQASQSDYVRDLMDDFEGRPEEIREVIGTESRELSQYKAKMEARARREEELFTRAPLTRMEKKKAKHLMKSRNGLLGLTDSFYDEVKTLPLADDVDDKMTGFDGDSGMRKMKRRKRKH